MYVIFGQEQDGFGSDYQVEQSFSGDMAAISFWTRALEAPDIAKLASCQESTLTGNLLNPDTFAIQDVVKTDLPLEDFCKEDILRNVLLWPKAISYKEFKDFCDIAGGELPVMEHNNDIINMTEKVKELLVVLNDSTVLPFKQRFTPLYLLGNQFSVERGSWINPYTQERLDSFQLQINSVTELYSAVSGGNLLSMTGTTTQGKGICRLKRDNFYFVRGLCDTGDIDFFDTMYYIRGTRNSRPYFRGFRRSEIFYDKANDTWVMRSLQNPNRYMHQKADHGKTTHPFGRHLWITSKRGVTCGLLEGQERELTFSPCQIDQYPCSSGTCIDLG